jgi:hypothetical protein
MPSQRKIDSNRVNAQRSTGPKSAEGKARSRGNAFKHGLAVPASSILELASDVAHLAQMLAGENEMDPVVREAAARVADAAIDVLRARRARTELLDRMARSPDFLLVAAAEPMPTQLLSYKSSSLTTRIRTILNRTFDELRQTEVAQIRQVYESNEARQRVKLHNADVQRRLADWNLVDKLSRYEGRALSRRDKAIRMLDEARAAKRSKANT